MGFSLLALLGLVALLGPLVNWPRHFSVPVVVGELAVGVILGVTGFGIFDSQDDTFDFMAQIGFGLVMFVAGTNVPTNRAQLGHGLAVGARNALLVGVAAAAVGGGIGRLFGTGHGLLYAVVLASSSASLVIPALGTTQLTGPKGTQMLVQIALADAAAIITLPLVLDPKRVVHAAVGSVAVIAAAAAYAFIGRFSSKEETRLRRVSKQHGYALEMRIVLIMLFAMSALAEKMGVSVMLAGFALGIAFSIDGEPKRLKKQMFALTEGFFAPIFYIWLGASIDLRQLFLHPEAIVLGVTLGLTGIIVHLVPALLKQPIPMAIATAGQLGVPVGAVALGQSEGLLTAWEAPALFLGALVTIVLVSLAVPRVAARATD